MLGDDGLEKGFKLQTQTELYSKGPQYHPTRKDGLSREKEGKDTSGRHELEFPNHPSIADTTAKPLPSFPIRQGAPLALAC